MSECLVRGISTRQGLAIRTYCSGINFDLGRERAGGRGREGRRTGGEEQEEAGRGRGARVGGFMNAIESTHESLLRLMTAEEDGDDDWLAWRDRWQGS